MAKARLGELLVKAGVISESQLRITLSQQRQHGGKLGEHLVRTNLVTEQQIAIAVADQLGLVYNDCSDVHAAAFTAMITPTVADQLQALPVRYDEATDTLHVAVADPLDETVLMTLQRVTGKRIELQVAPKGHLRQVIKGMFAEIEIHDEGTNEFALVDLAGRESQVISVRHDRHDDELPEASVIDMDPIHSSHLPMPTSRPAPFPVQPGLGGSGPLQPARIPAPSIPTPAGARRVAPPPPVATPVPTPVPAPPKPAPQAAQHDAAEEAMRMIWALTDILIEKGYLSRSELMAKLRNR